MDTCARHLLVCAAFFCAPFLLSAQSPNLVLSYQKTDSLFVCGTDTFTITIQNNGGALSAGATLTFALPNGITYVPASVSGANQLNVSNLQSPTFSLPGIPANATAVVKTLLTADCAAATVLDAGGLFLASISIDAPNASASITTTSIPVETGLLLIESVEDDLMEGERFDTLYRKICVTNTRLGRIGDLHFEDAHLPGFEVSIAAASAQTNNASFFSAELPATLFSSTGNGDTWLDLDESVCFTEKIIITDCGSPEYINPSLLRVGWGCGAESCRYDSAYANINISSSTTIPVLQFTPVWNPPTDHCADVGATLGVRIKNNGLGDATNVSVKFAIPQSPSEVAINPATLRIVAANGTITPLTPNLIKPAILQDCNKQAAENVLLTLPFLKAQDSLQILFDVLTCAPNCTQQFPEALVEYFYLKNCPVNGFVSDTLIIASNPAYTISSQIKAGVGACFVSGNTYPIEYQVRSLRLLESNGFLNIDLEVPHGLTLDPSCGDLVLNGVNPVAQTTSLNNSGALTVHLTFPLPFSVDTAVMHLCLHYECDSFLICENPPTGSEDNQYLWAPDCIPCYVRLQEKTYWSPSLSTPYECSIGDCNEYFWAVDGSCSGLYSDGSVIGNPIPGLPTDYSWKMTVERTNYGLRDHDDDRKADDGTKAPPGEIRLDRYLPGDTSRVFYCGFLDTGKIVELRRYVWHEVTLSDAFGPWGNDQFNIEEVRKNFTNASKFRFIRDSIRIHYADGAQVAFVIPDFVDSMDQHAYSIFSVNSFPIAAVDQIVTQRHDFIASFSDLFNLGLVPKPELTTGDSIFFYTDFKLDMNFHPTIPGRETPNLLGFRTAVGHAPGLFAWNHTQFQRMQYSGFNKFVSKNTFSIKPCENSVEASKFRYYIKIARENMFPFEVRPLATITDYSQTVPPDIPVVSTQLKYLAMQDSLPILGVTPLPNNLSAGILQVDFSPAFSMPIDEGFMLGASTVFGPNCEFAKPDTSLQQVTTRFTGCLNGQFPLALDNIRNGIGFFANHPSLVLSSPNGVINSPTRPFEAQLELSNPEIPPAPHPWIIVESPSGQVTDFELFKMPQNQPIAGQNNIFNLPVINGLSDLNLRLTGVNSQSCETEIVRVIFGWDCAPIADANATSCFRDTFDISLNLEKPELELNVLQEPENMTLCDTSDYFEFEIYNAKVGYAYELFGSVELPSGMTVVPGTSQIFYAPTGAWVNINDPQLASANLFIWNISENQPFIQQNGLPGIDLAPQNSVKIRFRTVAGCGFVANAQNIYGASGKEPCGRSTNTLNKPGDPINIEGLNPTYGVAVSLQQVGTDPGVCGGNQTFLAQINLLGTPSIGDSAFISLPAGTFYVPGSYVAGQNAPSTEPTITAQGFQIPLPILAGGGMVQFHFAVSFGPGAACQDQSLTLQTRVHTEAFCASLGMPCDVYISTGESSLLLNVEHAEFSFGAPQLTQTNGLTNVTVPVTNAGASPTSGIYGEIWRDVDGNGAVSPGDILLQSMESNATMAPGQSISLSDTIAVTDLCGLILVFPGDNNCFCDDKTFPINDLTISKQPLTICQLDTFSIGIPAVAGHNYQWQSNAGISCDTCATTLFNPSGAAGQMQFLILEESSGFCTIKHLFTINFGLTASISANNAVVCSGQPVVLNATPASQSYAWSGPGISDPGAQALTLHPSASADYSVTITLSNGCTAADTVSVAVLPTDTLVLPVIKACEGTSITVFGNTVAAEHAIFHVSTVNQFGCDSTILQPVEVLPKVMTEESVVFCQGHPIFVFDSIEITATGDVCQQFTSINGCDSTHCYHATMVLPPDLPQQDTIFSALGTEITLSGLPGFATYTWSPEPAPPCLNCSEITVKPDSTGNITYVLTVTDNNGCPGEAIWNLVVFPPCDPKNVKVPNAFTPNNDGANDIFRPITTEGGEIIGRLTIYDRWGEKIFENSQGIYWDGTIHGVTASSDVYVYIIEVFCSNQLSKIVGDVTLIR